MTTAVVVDASALLGWLLGDLPEVAGRFERALAGRDSAPLIAPALIRSEVANALAVATRRLRLTPAQARQAAALADDAPIALEATSLSSAQLLLIAQTHALTAYDAQYLELAMRRGAALLTADAALTAAAAQAGVESV